MVGKSTETGALPVIAGVVVTLVEDSFLVFIWRDDEEGGRTTVVLPLQIFENILAGGARFGFVAGKRGELSGVLRKRMDWVNWGRERF
jgi:hypothetical protein